MSNYNEPVGYGDTANLVPSLRIINDLQNATSSLFVSSSYAKYALTVCWVSGPILARMLFGSNPAT